MSLSFSTSTAASNLMTCRGPRRDYSIFTGEGGRALLLAWDKEDGERAAVAACMACPTPELAMQAAHELEAEL